MLSFQPRPRQRHPRSLLLSLKDRAYKETVLLTWPKSPVFYSKSFHMAWVIKSNGKIIVGGSNWNHRHGKSERGHAERVAWHKYQKFSKKSGIYKKHETLYMVVIRIKKDGTLGMSKPCCKCQASFSPKIKKVIYSTGDPDHPFDYMDL